MVGAELPPYRNVALSGDYRDVNGDGFVTPADVMAIVNSLNARFTPRGEGESSLAAVLSNSMAAPLQTLPDRPLREATLAMDFAENGSQGETRGVAHSALLSTTAAA